MAIDQNDCSAAQIASPCTLTARKVSAAICFPRMGSSVDLLHCWATSSCSRWGTPRHTTRHSIWHATLATCCLVDLHHDGVHNTFQLLLLGFKFVLLSEL